MILFCSKILKVKKHNVCNVYDAHPVRLKHSRALPRDVCPPPPPHDLHHIFHSELHLQREPPTDTMTSEQYT